MNSYLSVDTFLFLSGLLCCYVFFRDITKKGYYDVPVAYINRYLRLTPPFAVMILIAATIVTYLGDGPIWHKVMEPKIAQCKTHWWLDLLYVQNYITIDDPVS